jgi:hypothetical protein
MLMKEMKVTLAPTDLGVAFVLVAIFVYLVCS